MILCKLWLCMKDLGMKSFSYFYLLSKVIPSHDIRDLVVEALEARSSNISIEKKKKR